MTEPPAFEASTGFLLSQLGVRATRSWTTMLAGFELTPHHHGVILVLRQSGELGLTQLARALSIDPRNMGPILDPLEKRELVGRVADAGDRRRRAAALTVKGSALAHELASAADRIETDFISALSAVERERLREILRKLWAST